MTEANDRFFFDTISDKFENIRSQYDVQRRLEIVFEELLPESLEGRRVLDAGCANGRFSCLAIARKANVTSFDISHSLVVQAHKNKYVDKPVTSDVLAMPFADKEFDIVISSEVIEHVMYPRQAIKEMSRVLKPGGILALTCPNRLWEWPIQISTKLGLRYSLGYERFPGFTELEVMITQSGLRLETNFGFHPWPFQLRSLQNLSRHVDHYAGKNLWGKAMINQAIRAVRASI